MSWNARRLFEDERGPRLLFKQVMPSERTRSEQLRCPECKSGSGRPLRVQSETNNQLSVAMRCGECGNEWALDRESKGVLMFPKPDRRKKLRKN